MTIEAVTKQFIGERRLQELGFIAGEYGDWFSLNCRVTLYAVFGEWEVDIVLPNGSAVGFDIPITKLAGRTKAEAQSAKPGC
jgi:hypothetical protein